MAISLDQFIKRIDTLKNRELTRIIEDETEDIAAFAEDLARRNASTRMRVISGNLVRSIQAHVVTQPKSVRMTLSAGNSRVPYAAIQEFGGTIVAKNPTGFLWIPQGDGSFRLVRSVTLPARRYMRDARKATTKKFRGQIPKAIKRYAETGRA